MSATAIPHRAAKILLQVSSDIDYQSDADWVRKAQKTLKPHSNGHAFYNFLDCESETHERGLWKSYFGQNVRRLKRIKQHWDPDGRLPTFCDLTRT